MAELVHISCVLFLISYTKASQVGHNLPRIEYPDLPPPWTNILLPGPKSALYHPPGAWAKYHVLVTCTASYPIKWKINGYLSHRDRIRFQDTRRSFKNNTFTLALYLDFNSYLKISNYGFSFEIRCEKYNSSIDASSLFVFIRGDGNSSLIQNTETKVVQSKTIPCVTVDPFMKTTLLKTHKNGSSSPIDDSQIQFNPTKGFQSDQVFNGTYICRQGDSEISVQASLSANSLLHKYFDVKPTRDIMYLKPGEEATLECIAKQNTTLNFFSRNNSVLATTLISTNSVSVAFKNTAVPGQYTDVACVAQTGIRKSLVYQWRFELTQSFDLVPDNYYGEFNCFAKGSPRVLTTLRCKSPMHCDYLEACLRKDSNCNSVDRVTYNSSYEDFCKNRKTGDISECTAAPYSHLSGRAVCYVGTDSRRWDFFVSLNYLKYVNWNDAPKAQLIRMDETASVLYTNQTSVFLCEAVAYLFAASWAFKIEFKNGTELIIEKDSEYAHVEHADETNDRAIRDFNHISILRVNLSLDAVAVHCLAPWINDTNALNTTRQFETRHLLMPSFKESMKVHQEFHIGDNKIRIVCPVTAEPAPSYVWSFRNISVTDSLPELRSFTGSNGYGFLEFPRVTDSFTAETYSGTYTCTASNFIGSVNASSFVKFTERTQNHSVVYTSVGIASLVIVCVLGFALYVFVRKYQIAQDLIRDLTDKEIEEFFNGNPELITNSGQNTFDCIDFQPYKKEYEIPDDDLEIDNSDKKYLGSGHFACVLRGRVVSTSMAVAIKVSKPNLDVSYFKSLLTEVKIMMYIGDHENIVKFIGVSTKNIRSQSLKIATEICELGSLETLLRNSERTFVNLLNSNQQVDMTLAFQGNLLHPSTLSTLDLVWICAQTANGLAYLGSKSVIHGDLATRNILLMADKSVRISDFGLSKKLYGDSNYVKKSKVCGYISTPLPWRWMAIESLKTLTFSVQSDVWAFGATLYEIFSLGGIPFPNENWNDDFIQRLSSGMRMGRPKYCTPEIYTKMVGCWEVDPEQRPDFANLNSYFFNMTKNLLSAYSVAMADHERSAGAPKRNILKIPTNMYANATNNIYENR